MPDDFKVATTVLPLFFNRDLRSLKSTTMKLIYIRG